MTTNWQSLFDSWAKPPSDTEIDERDHTEKQVKNALQAWPALARRNFRVFVKGSYWRATNVRRGADVDLAVELLGVAPMDQAFVVTKEFKAKGLTDAELNLTDAPPEYSRARATFKDDCLDALVDAFGPTMVERHNKCITVSEKSTTLPADVVPCTTHRRYDSRSVSSDGVQITPDHGPSIINWPQQDHDNGIAKNARTSRRYKRVVRGLKALEDLMAESGSPETPSWLVECLVYNVPDEVFDSSSNHINALTTLLWLHENLASTSGRGDWLEVNELKYLFTVSQPWSTQEASDFVARAMRLLTS